jgi:hypothetical protein
MLSPVYLRARDGRANIMSKPVKPYNVQSHMTPSQPSKSLNLDGEGFELL